MQLAISVLADSQQTAMCTWLDLRKKTEHHISWGHADLLQAPAPWQTCCWPLPAPSCVVSSAMPAGQLCESCLFVTSLSRYLKLWLTRALWQHIRETCCRRCQDSAVMPGG